MGPGPPPPLFDGHNESMERAPFLCHCASVCHVFCLAKLCCTGLPSNPALFPSLDWWNTSPSYGKSEMRSKQSFKLFSQGVGSVILGSSWSLWWSTAQEGYEKENNLEEGTSFLGHPQWSTMFPKSISESVKGFAESLQDPIMRLDHEQKLSSLISIHQFTLPLPLKAQLSFKSCVSLFLCFAGNTRP